MKNTHFKPFYHLVWYTHKELEIPYIGLPSIRCARARTSELAGTHAQWSSYYQKCEMFENWTKLGIQSKDKLTSCYFTLTFGRMQKKKYENCYEKY